MPVRLIDGDAIWQSNKISLLEEKYRSEYVWLLSLAEANACFECDPRAIWAKCYAMLRPGWTQEDIEDLLDAFEKAKLLFRFKLNKKTYGFFVGMEKRLPKKSDRSKYKNSKPIIPAEGLAAFLGEDVATISPLYRDVLANSIGVGVGRSGSEGIGRSEGVGVGSEQDATPSPFGNSFTSPFQEPTPTPTQNLNTGPELAQYFRSLLRQNPNATSVPANWNDLFLKDVNDLLKRHSPETIRLMMELSQTKENQKFYVRTQTLIKNEEILLDKAKRLLKRGGAMPPSSGGPPKLEYEHYKLDVNKGQDKLFEEELDEL